MTVKGNTIYCDAPTCENSSQAQDATGYLVADTIVARSLPIRVLVKTPHLTGTFCSLACLAEWADDLDERRERGETIGKEFGVHLTQDDEDEDEPEGDDDFRRPGQYL